MLWLQFLLLLALHPGKERWRSGGFHHSESLRTKLHVFQHGPGKLAGRFGQLEGPHLATLEDSLIGGDACEALALEFPGSRYQGVSKPVSRLKKVVFARTVWTNQGSDWLFEESQVFDIHRGEAPEGPRYVVGNDDGVRLSFTPGRPVMWVPWTSGLKLVWVVGPGSTPSCRQRSCGLNTTIRMSKDTDNHKPQRSGPRGGEGLGRPMIQAGPAGSSVRGRLGYPEMSSSGRPNAIACSTEQQGEARNEERQ